LTAKRASGNAHHTQNAPLETQLLYPGEAAKLLKVDRKTLTRWAEKGLIRSYSTPGGHRRYLTADIQLLLNNQYPVGTRTPRRMV
jgi:excisionase family DNA binding protein